MFATAWTSTGRWGRAPWKLILTTIWRDLKLGAELRKLWRFMTFKLWVSLSLFSLAGLSWDLLCAEQSNKAVRVNMASLWFGAGNNWNPLLWRRQMLHKIPNQSKPSAPGSSQQRDADVWPGTCTLFDINADNWKGKNTSLIGVIQGFSLFFHVRQTNYCLRRLVRSPWYGFQQSSHWRTPHFWATKFWIFVANFPFSGSSLLFLKVLFLFLYVYPALPRRIAALP